MKKKRGRCNLKIASQNQLGHMAADGTHTWGLTPPSSTVDDVDNDDVDSDDDIDVDDGYNDDVGNDDVGNDDVDNDDVDNDDENSGGR